MTYRPMESNNKHSRWRRFGIVLGTTLTVALSVDLARLVKPSGLAAAFCVPGLLRSAMDEPQFIETARSTIIRESMNNDLPGLLVAAIAIDHRRQVTRYRAFTDCLGSALGADLSLGPAQIRMSTAAQLDGHSFATMSATAHRRLRAKLLEANTNISYEARELRSLLERQHRSPGISASALLSNPATMALLITEYRSGRMLTAEKSSPVGANALRTLRLLQDDALSLFRDPGFDITRSQAEIEAYFAAIRCQSGKSNRRCARESQKSPQAEKTSTSQREGSTVVPPNSRMQRSGSA
jgi:hypothetical protein